MFYFLYTLLGSEWPQLRLFRYVSFRALMAALTALLICFVVGPWLIRRLTELKLGQPIRTKEEVNQLAELHGQKRGIPTMGGLLLVLAVVVSALLWSRPTQLLVMLCLGSLVAFGLVGFWDDYLKVVKKQSKGLSAKAKLLGQIMVAVTVGLVLCAHPETEQKSRQLYLPFYKHVVIGNLGWLFVLLALLVTVGASNAVNLTDGLDGLAIGCTITVSGVYALLAYLGSHAIYAHYLYLPHIPNGEELAVLCAALLGASMGFLWFNCNPAKVFMGDTGSLALGGFLGVVALCLRQEFLLVLVGGVFVLEACSVILQVMSFKLTGKRIFAMAPLHHHFELKGWSENTVVVRFWIASILFALLGLSSLKIR